MHPQNNAPGRVPVAALVVGYLPEVATLDQLLLTLDGEVGLVVLLDNGGAGDFLVQHDRARDRIYYEDMGGNKGLGGALNRGMQIARNAGFRYVVTFDQDSAPYEGTIRDLYDALQEIKAVDASCVAVGPTFYDRRDEDRYCFPLYREESGVIRVMRPEAAPRLAEVDVLITSGMLVDSDVWARGYKYEHGLFVDYTDTDWCFRVREAGYKLFAITSVRMPHALSDAPSVRLFNIRLLQYSPVRRYYYFRNTVYFLRRKYVSNAWKRRLACGLVVRLSCNIWLDNRPFYAIKLSVIGVWHGLLSKLGDYHAE